MGKKGLQPNISPQNINTISVFIFCKCYLQFLHKKYLVAFSLRNVTLTFYVLFNVVFIFRVIIVTAQIETGCRRSRRPKSESVTNRNCIWARAYKYNFHQNHLRMDTHTHVINRQHRNKSTVKTETMETPEISVVCHQTCLQIPDFYGVEYMTI